MNVIYRYDYNEKITPSDNKNEFGECAKKLSEIFGYVKVDLYNIDGKIIFSELTFHSGGGLSPFIAK